jgi:UDP-glucose 4-epimerase
MHKKIIVIGGNGFIGSHLVEALLQTGASVRVLDRCDELFRPRLAGVEYLHGNFADVATLKTALQGCGMVVHMAHGSTPVTSTVAPVDEVLGSMGAFTALLECVRDAEVERFVFFSSGGAVYGVPDRNPVNEDHAERPISPYGVSKVCMEKYLRMFAHIHGLPYLILRPANAYGPRQNYMARQGIIPISIYRILTNQRIAVWGDGRTAKDYLYIDDLIKGTVGLLASSVKNETVNLGSGGAVSINTILGIVRGFCGKAGDVVYEPSMVADVHDIVLDCERIRRYTDWVASTSIDEGIERTYRWISDELRKS